ncbi:MAG TPA: HAD family hydrolase [Acidimicrobiales bacterium]|nr:HAD family hydrolase [Acidimicrobiales bacterium]
MRKVAAFDFDGTLVPGDSLLPFLVRVCGRRRAATALGVLGPSIGVALARGGARRDAAKAALVSRLLRGLPAAEVARAGEAFASVLLPRARPDMLARVGWHRDSGHELVLVSASLSVYLEPLGAMLGFDHVLATGLEVGQDGLLTGRLLGANVRGPEKAVRVREWLGADLCELWAYGDSAGDHDLFALAQWPYLVTRRGTLRPWP